MAFCTKCGHQLEENVKFCPACGEATEKTEHAADEQTEHVNEPASAAQSSSKEADNDKLMGLLAYLSILVLVPILAASDSKFARFHANQGLLLLICEAVWSAVSGVLGVIFFWIPFISLPLSALNVVFLVFTIIGIVNVCNGEEKELPIIGKYRLLK